MARAHRAALIATITTVTYLLLFFNIFTVPLLDAKIAEQILWYETLSPILKHLGLNQLVFLTDPLVASCCVWILLFIVDWDGSG